MECKRKKISCNYSDYLFKFLIIGDYGVGKSALMLRFADDVFSDLHISTIGVHIKVRSIELDGSKIKMQLWDTAGQDRFRSIMPAYYRGAHGVLLVYDVTDKESFDNITRWADEAVKYTSSESVKFLVANKADLENNKLIDYSEGKALADHLGMSFLETSAKDRTNVEQAFVSMATEVKAKVENAIDPSPCISALKVNSTNLSASNTRKKKIDCNC